MSSEMITTFSRRNGKIVKTEKPRYVETGRKGDYSGTIAKKKINAMLSQMKYEIDNSEKGQRSGKMMETKSSFKFVNTSSRSTFPNFLSETGINTRKDFTKVMESKKGIRYNRLRGRAIIRLNKGFENSHGYDAPDMEFRTKTGQVWDNQDVVFRRIRGRIVPIRNKSKKKRKELNEVPF